MLIPNQVLKAFFPAASGKSNITFALLQHAYANFRPVCLEVWLNLRVCSCIDCWEGTCFRSSCPLSMVFMEYAVVFWEKSNLLWADGLYTQALFILSVHSPLTQGLVLLSVFVCAMWFLSPSIHKFTGKSPTRQAQTDTLSHKRFSHWLIANRILSHVVLGGIAHSLLIYCLTDQSRLLLTPQLWARQIL